MLNSLLRGECVISCSSQKLNDNNDDVGGERREWQKCIVMSGQVSGIYNGLAH